MNIRDNKDVRRYLQKHALLISSKSCLYEKFTISEYVKVVSTLWSNNNLTKAVITGFNLEDLQHKYIYELDVEIKRVLLLSRLLTCPSHLWIIDNDIFINSFTKVSYLSNENAEIINNIFDIRIKQGGAILLL